MNAKDRNQVAQIRSQADALMNGTGGGVTNADIVEALLGDLTLIGTPEGPRHLAALAESLKTDAERAETARREQLEASAAAHGITVRSLELFLDYAGDAGNWSGTPMVDGNVGDGRGGRGNLTQLKRKKLLTTFRSNGETWVEFTPEGLLLAARYGITF